MQNNKLLDILICPITKEKLSIAPEQIISLLNSQIAEQKLKNYKGDLIEIKLEKGLVNNTNSYLYPIMSEIPVLLPDEAIPLSSNQPVGQ